MAGHHDAHDPHHGHGGPAGAGEADLAEVLDLDAEVLHEYLSEAIGWILGVAGDRPRLRILDVGAGTGVGTFALLEQVAGSEVTALDVSPEMLDRLAGKAQRLGVTDRVRTVRADLNESWPALDPVDLVWASSSLHHMADPDRALAEVFAVLRPGGLLAVTEMDSFPRFLPDDAGAALEERCHAALAGARAEQVPHQGDDWGARLSAAGFTVEAHRVFAIALTPPLPAAARRYAQVSLRRMRTGLDGLISADDAAALDRLLEDDGDGGVLRRDDLTVRSTRAGWVASRPAGEVSPAARA